MKHEEAKSREMADAYVCGRLTPAESDAFEAHYFECGECWEDVEALQALRDGVKDAARRGVFAAAAPAEYWKWAFAAAAMLLVGLATWTFGLEIPRLRQEVARALQVAPPPPVRVEVPVVMAQANLPLVMLEASRADEATAVKVPAAARQLAFWLDAPAGGRGSFRFVLLDAQGTTVETLEGLTANSHGALTAAVSSDRVPIGRYTARLFGANGALTAEYKFTISR